MQARLRRTPFQSCESRDFKTDSGYHKDARVTINSLVQTLKIPSYITPFVFVCLSFFLSLIMKTHFNLKSCLSQFFCMTTFLAQTVIFLICCLLFQTTYICSGHICVHPKTLIEIAMVLSTNSGSFPSNSHVSATFLILLRFGEFWIPTNLRNSMLTGR